jgi:hypothetical protein
MRLRPLDLEVGVVTRSLIGPKGKRTRLPGQSPLPGGCQPIQSIGLGYIFEHGGKMGFSFLEWKGCFCFCCFK